MYLQQIIDYKRGELEAQKRKVSLKDVRKKAEDAEPTRDFLGALTPGPSPAKGRGEIRVIAEIKKASPSAGVIREDFDPVGIALQYEEGGAVALSVLTDEHFFQGRLEHLAMVKKKVSLPLLRKDFTLDVYHLYEARGAGADAVLLIARVLEKSQIKDYSSLAGELGMAALVEVHDEEDLKKIGDLGLPLIGINNRDLNTFQTDLETSVRLRKWARQKGVEAVFVSESGLANSEDLKRLQVEGIDAFLIGESLLRAPDPGKKLREMIQGGIHG